MVLNWNQHKKMLILTISLSMYLSNNDRLIVTLGHSETRYDIQNNSAMITFLNVRDITAMPYYWEDANESVTNITQYSNNDIFDGYH